jgi:mono/diheme cytochrome c family protein
LAMAPDAREDPGWSSWLRELTGATYIAAAVDDAPNGPVTALLALADELPREGEKLAMLAGIAEAQRRPGDAGGGRFELAEPHPLFMADPEQVSTELQAALRQLRRNFTWPGDETPGGARPLTADEEVLREAGRQLFAQGCAACHGADGRGQTGVAPSLVGAPWVRDSDEWLVRIALHGLRDRIVIAGEEWNGMMPGHGHDPRFDDDGLAGVLTHLRRAWGHADEPVTPATVARIRSETSDRATPWTVEELLQLDIEHRLDRYVGVYSPPLISIELEVVRRVSTLAFGMKGGGKAELAEVGDGMFSGEGMLWEFETDADGVVEGASVTREGTRFPVSKEE